MAVKAIDCILASIVVASRYCKPPFFRDQPFLKNFIIWRISMERPSKRAKSPHVSDANNRLSLALAEAGLNNSEGMSRVLRGKGFRPTDLAATYRSTYARAPTRAVRLAQAYAVNIADASFHRELFQDAALMPTEQRRSLIEGYRRAGQTLIGISTTSRPVWHL